MWCQNMGAAADREGRAVEEDGEEVPADLLVRFPAGGMPGHASTVRPAAHSSASRVSQPAWVAVSLCVPAVCTGGLGWVTLGGPAAICSLFRDADLRGMLGPVSRLAVSFPEPGRPARERRRGRGRRHRGGRRLRPASRACWGR